MSGYDKDARSLPIRLNKKVIGLMKDDLRAKMMTEFVGLRPKLYAYRKLNGVEDARCRGIKRCVVKKIISFDDYKKCLFNVNSKLTYRSQLIFRNNKHKIHTVKVNKVPRSPYPSRARRFHRYAIVLKSNHKAYLSA